MDIGDRIRVIELQDEDKKYTDLKVGDIGIVVGLNGICNVRFEKNIKHDSRNWNDENKSYDMFDGQLESIQELELDELKQYQAIGTVEECRKAVEKQTPKKVIDAEESTVSGILFGRCPTRGCTASTPREHDMYCSKCGQRLDWGR